MCEPAAEKGQGAKASSAPDVATVAAPDAAMAAAAEGACVGAETAAKDEAAEPSTPARDDPRYRMRDPYNDPPTRNMKLARFAAAVACVLVVAVVGFFAWDNLRPPDIAAYESQEITIKGLTDAPFTVTVAELAELNCTRLSASGTGGGENGESKAGTVNAYGPTLETFLAQYGHKPYDFGRIIFTCKEEQDSEGNNYNYNVTLLDDQLQEEIILSIASGKNALDEYAQPMRLVILEEATGQWAYGVTQIEFQGYAEGS